MFKIIAGLLETDNYQSDVLTFTFEANTLSVRICTVEITAP